MKYFTIFIFLFSYSINAFSQDLDKLLFNFNEQYYYYDKFEKDSNASLKIVFPPIHESSIVFVDFSLGISYGLVQEYFYIGVAGDLALGPSWFALFSDDNNSNYNKNNNNDSEILQIGASLGARIYNLFQISNFRIWSFFGCDFLFIILPMPYAGIELSYKILGLEYAYYFPIYEDTARHQISIKFHFPKDF